MHAAQAQAAVATARMEVTQAESQHQPTPILSSAVSAAQAQAAVAMAEAKIAEARIRGNHDQASELATANAKTFAAEAAAAVAAAEAAIAAAEARRWEGPGKKYRRGNDSTRKLLDGMAKGRENILKLCSKTTNCTPGTPPGGQKRTSLQQTQIEKIQKNLLAYQLLRQIPSEATLIWKKAILHANEFIYDVIPPVDMYVKYRDDPDEAAADDGGAEAAGWTVNEDTKTISTIDVNKTWGPFKSLASKNKTLFTDLEEGGLLGGSSVVLMYGYSGSGKTYTMVTGRENDPSIIKQFLAKVQNVTLQCYEWYGRSKTGFTVSQADFETKWIEYRYSEEGGQDIVGIDIENVTAAPFSFHLEGEAYAKFEHIFTQINKVRCNAGRVAMTPNNDESSRGHLFMKFNYKPKAEQQGRKWVVFVDMAGSENSIDMGSEYFHIHMNPAAKAKDGDTDDFKQEIKLPYLNWFLDDTKQGKGEKERLAFGTTLGTMAIGENEAAKKRYAIAQQLFTTTPCGNHTNTIREFTPAHSNPYWKSTRIENVDNMITNAKERIKEGIFINETLNQLRAHCLQKTFASTLESWKPVADAAISTKTIPNGLRALVPCYPPITAEQIAATKEFDYKKHADQTWFSIVRKEMSNQAHRAGDAGTREENVQEEHPWGQFFKRCNIKLYVDHHSLSVTDGYFTGKEDPKIMWKKSTDSEEGTAWLLPGGVPPDMNAATVFLDSNSRFSTNLQRNLEKSGKQVYTFQVKEDEVPDEEKDKEGVQDVVGEEGGQAQQKKKKKKKKKKKTKETSVHNFIEASAEASEFASYSRVQLAKPQGYTQLCTPIPEQLPVMYDYNKLLPNSKPPTFLEKLQEVAGAKVEFKLMIVSTLRTNSKDHTTYTKESLDFIETLNPRSARWAKLQEISTNEVWKKLAHPPDPEHVKFIYLDTVQDNPKPPPDDFVLARTSIAENPTIRELLDTPAAEPEPKHYRAWVKKDSVQMAQYALDRLWEGGTDDEQFRKAAGLLGMDTISGGGQPLLVLPYDAHLAPVVRTLPATHELGGHLLTGGGGRLDRIVTFAGDACRDATGKRLTATRQCKIRKPDASISFHTHPKSNRPSSADLRNAVLKHPDFRRHKTPGKRRLSLVVTPEGVWTYAPKPALVQRWRRMRSPDIQAAMADWSRQGRRRAPAELVTYMQAQGMELAYFPHAALQGKTLRVDQAGRARADPA